MADMLNYDIQDVLGEMWQEACGKGSSLNFKIISRSMSPMIEVGNVVTVSRVEPDRIRIGDIVAFREGQKVVVHRIIGRSRTKQQLTFYHRGDAGADSGRILAEAIIGRASVIKKEGREIFLDTPRYIVINKILGWRLRIRNSLGRMQPRYLGILIHQALRPLWRLWRNFLLWRI